MRTALEWTDELSVGVELIDEQHKYFIGLINRLVEVVEKKEPRSVSDMVLQELRNYTKFHFDTEEKLFEQVKYDKLKEHAYEHRKLASVVDAFIVRAQRSNYNYATINLLIAFLIDWLVFHLDKVDKQYIDIFHQHGIF